MAKSGKTNRTKNEERKAKWKEEKEWEKKNRYNAERRPENQSYC